MTKYRVDIRFTKAFIGHAVQDIEETDDLRAIEIAQSLYDDNPMIERIIVWNDRDILKIISIPSDRPIYLS